MKKWQDVTPKKMLEWVENGESEPKQIIDVRELFEWEYYHLEGSTLIPMNEIPSRMSELDDTRPIYIVCAHGVRSVAVCNYLEEQGYSNLRNVSGGMAAIASIKGFQYD
jgi:rhodanese-related sulfurtransferase